MSTIAVEWRPIKDFEGIYEINNEGLMRRCADGSTFTGSINSYGYRVTTLRGPNGKRDVKVHRLVAAAFLPNPGNKRTVNHKDGNRSNNCVANLEWATYKEQAVHAQTLPTISYRGKRVIQMTPNYKLVAVWENCNIAATVLGFNQMMISACCQGTAASAYGYLWAYSDGESAQKDAALMQINHFMREIERKNPTG